MPDGHVERDVVGAEVGVELGQVVERKVTPLAVRLEPGELRETTAPTMWKSPA